MIIKAKEEAMPLEVEQSKELLRKHSLKFKGPIERVRHNGYRTKGILSYFLNADASFKKAINEGTSYSQGTGITIEVAPQITSSTKYIDLTISIRCSNG